MTRVLVVEDEPDIRLLIVVNLESAGFEVIEASTGEEGLELVDRADVLLLDIRLPGIDGFEVMEQIGRPFPLPIVAMSAHSSETARDHALALGCAGWLQKPFAPRHLVALLQDVAAAD